MRRVPMRWRTRYAPAPLLFLALLLVACSAAAGRLTLDGRAIQGGLLLGRTMPEATVTHDGAPVRVSPEGAFVIGFGHDAPATSRLRVRFPDGRLETRRFEIETRQYDVQRIDGLPSRMVTPRAADLERIRAENALIRALRQRDTAAPYYASGFVWPLVGPITGVFGSRRILNGQERQPHFGIDIAAPRGATVVAPADGVVVLAHPDMFYTGATLIIDHGHGLTSAFLHLSALLVEEGEPVRQGTPVGEVGASGRATGPHLDWRVNLFDKRLDPQFLAGPMPRPEAQSGQRR